MSIKALIFDLDGTLADTEEGHRVAFNLAFERYRLGWNWSRDEYRALLKTTGGKERLGAYIERLTLSPAERQRLNALLPAIHAEKTKELGPRIHALLGRVIKRKPYSCVRPLPSASMSEPAIKSTRRCMR